MDPTFTLSDYQSPEKPALSSTKGADDTIHQKRDVYIQRNFTYTGKEDHLLWKEYGVNLHFPSCDQLVEIHGTVSVVSTSDEHIFPEGSEVVSAVYDISVTQPFPDKITVELEHCVDLKDDEASLPQMSFAVADTEHGPPYRFRTLTGGKFGVGQYGRIQLNRFSRITNFIDWHLGHYIRFIGRVYYRPSNRAVFVVVKDLHAHIREIEDEFKSDKDSEKISLMCNRNCSSIKLEMLPPESNWKVIPLVEPPQIQMADIWQYQPGKQIPQIALKLKWEGIPKEGQVKLKVTGAQSEITISLLCGEPPIQPVQPLPMTETPPPPPSQMQPLIRQEPPLQHSPGAKCVPQSPPPQVQYPIISQKDIVKPNMVTLTKFHAHTGVINIIKDISPYYREVGTILLNDETGNKVATIKANCHDEGDEITHNIFKKWINEDPDATWSKLIQCLKDANLHSLAKKIEDSLHLM